MTREEKLAALVGDFRAMSAHWNHVADERKGAQKARALGEAMAWERAAACLFRVLAPESRDPPAHTPMGEEKELMELRDRIVYVKRQLETEAYDEARVTLKQLESLERLIVLERKDAAANALALVQEGQI